MSADELVAALVNTYTALRSAWETAVGTRTTRLTECWSRIPMWGSGTNMAAVGSAQQAVVPCGVVLVRVHIEDLLQELEDPVLFGVVLI